MTKVFSEGTERIYMTKDSRGESESYTAYSLVGYRNGKRVWTEGVAKNRANMRDDLREAVGALIS